MEILAFSAEQVRRLTKLSAGQLTYWDRTGFFHPTYADDARAFGRIYTFRDVVGLRVIAILRQEHGVSLQELRVVGEHLRKHHETPWSSLKLWVLGKRVYFSEPESGAVFPARGGVQRAIDVALEQVARDVDRAASRLRDRGADDIGRIFRNRYVMHNSPVVAGTRVPTSAIWNLHEAGYPAERIIREYPRVTGVDIAEALRFEAQKRASRRRAS
jgi:uncharacterized protein (DUF433 family)